jgi:hypothetical protein
MHFPSILAQSLMSTRNGYECATAQLSETGGSQMPIPINLASLPQRWGSLLLELAVRDRMIT